MILRISNKQHAKVVVDKLKLKKSSLLVMIFAATFEWN